MSLACPKCGDEILVRWARNSEKWQAYHPLRHWCENSGFGWYGATREEAIAEFQRFSESEVKSCAKTPEENPVSWSPKPPTNITESKPQRLASKPAPKVPPSGAATFQGMAFSAEGLSDEAVNALLTEREEHGS